MDITELKRRVSNGEIADLGESEEISVGKLKNSNGKSIDYSISHGWNLIFSKECSDQWGRHNLELLEYIDSQEYSDEELTEILESLQTEDFHWDWYAKSHLMRTDKYRWFYLHAENKPQGACVMFQPKGSALNGSSIFYIEFIAVAPWNRDCSIKERYLYGVGSVMLKSILDYAVNTLNLTPGFSLHSLPQSRGYYEKLSMVNIDKLDKDSLMYFELPMAEAEKLLGAQ